MKKKLAALLLKLSRRLSPVVVTVTERSGDYTATSPGWTWDARKSEETVLGAWLISNAKRLDIKIEGDGF